MNNKYDEVDILNIVWSILRKWRMLIILMVIGGVLLGSLKAYKDIRYINDNSAQAKELAEYNKALEEYQAEKDRLEKKKAYDEKSIRQLEYEEENCYILTVDPYKVNKRTVLYYIDSGYEIMPDLSYQNINYNTAIANIYNTALQNTDFDFIIRSGDDNKTLMNPVNASVKFQLIDTVVETSGSILKITITGLDEDKMLKLSKEIDTIISELHPIICERITDHTITVIDIKDAIVAEPSIKSIQDVFSTKRDQLYTDIENINKNLEELKEPTYTEPRFRISLKWVLFGCFGGVLIGAFLVFIKAVSGKALCVNDYKQRYNSAILGTIETKNNTRFDKWLLRKIGFFNTESIEQEKELFTKTLDTIHHEGPILLTGVVDKSDLEMISKELETDENIIVSDNLFSPEGMEAIKNAENAILIERVLKNDYKTIDAHKELIEGRGLKFLGFVVLE